MNMTFISSSEVKKIYSMGGDIFKVSRKRYLVAALGTNVKNTEIIM